jgi:chromosomal replication initiator protein
VENIVSLLDVVSSPWQSVLKCVRSECNDFGMAIFDAVSYEGFFDGYACLTVPDKFRETWLDSHYGDLLRRVFSKVLGPEFKDYRIRLLAPSEKVPEIKLTPAPKRAHRVAAPVAKKPVRQKLSLYANYRFETFVEGDCNSTALRACETVVEHPGDMGMNPLLIYGASGLGKTHLLQSIAARLQETRPEFKIVYRAAYDFLRDCVSMAEASFAGDKALYAERQQKFRENYDCDVLLVDDIQLLEKAPKSQERLASLVKMLRSKGKQVVLSCDRHPSSFKKLEQGQAPARDSKIPQLSANLLAHLENCVAFGLAEPDLNTRMGVIREKSKDLPFASDDREEICRFLSIPPRANVRLIEGTLNWLRAMHALNGVELNLACVKQLLVSPQNDGAKLTLKNISETVAASFRVDTVVLSSKRQDKGASLPRKVAMFLCRELTTESLQEVGKAFNRDYATVIAAIQSLVGLMNKDESLARQVQDIRYMLET